MNTTRTPVAKGEAAPSTRSEIEAFVADMRARVPAEGKGRLVFGLDATMSRQPTWDHACHLQAGMFEEAAALGGLSIQLIYFRSFRECRASRWSANPKELSALMTGLSCQGGHTQIGRVLSHVRKTAREQKIGALIFVGDAMEESLDELSHTAGEIGLLGVPAFMFQEGRDPLAEQAFREIARLTKGAYCRFDAASAAELGRLLRAAAAYAAGGRAALEDRARGDRHAHLLLEQMR